MWLDLVAPNAAALLLAVVLDRLLPEPPRQFHPVVWIGRCVTAMERLAPRSPLASFLYGCLVVLLVVGISTALTWLLVALLSTIGTLAYIAGATVLLRTTFTVRGLSVAALTTQRALDEDNLGQARASLRSLVSRDPNAFGVPLVAASAIESVAENSTDSFVAPWLAFALFGVPGAVAYRALNTLDSMIGYLGRYEYLGKAAAILDDVVNFVPARLTAILLLAGGAHRGLPARRGWQVMLKDRGRTASPNSGQTMSAMAGLLGVELEKPSHYVLGEGLRKPRSRDIGRAVRISEVAGLLAIVVALSLLAARIVLVG